MGSNGVENASMGTPNYGGRLWGVCEHLWGHTKCMDKAFGELVNCHCGLAGTGWYSEGCVTEITELHAR